jgi:hypothetical protein
MLIMSLGSYTVKSLIGYNVSKILQFSDCIGF